MAQESRGAGLAEHNHLRWRPWRSVLTVSARSHSGRSLEGRLAYEARVARGQNDLNSLKMLTTWEEASPTHPQANTQEGEAKLHPPCSDMLLELRG